MSAMPEVQPAEPSIVSDATLVERVGQNDTGALLELERRHRGSLYAQAYAILIDSTSAERVVHDVFAQLRHAAAHFVGPRPWSWLRDMTTEFARAERALRKTSPRR
jgi:DNA-directed RNA polymerase specialized sigma24 family protein